MPIFYGKSKDLSFKPDNQREWLDFLEKTDKKKLFLDVNLEKGRRSGPQNNALHKFYELLSNALNEGGYSVKKVLEKKMDLDWNEKLVKELLWRPAQEAITGKTSTTELDKVEEIDIVWGHLNRHLGEKFGVHVPFPKKEKDEFKIESIHGDLEVPEGPPKF